MTNPEASTSLSVRGEAYRTTPPDEARVHASVGAFADSKAAAMSAVQTAVSGILAELTQLSGQVLTAQSARAALTWSTQSLQTYEEQTHNKVSGEHGPTGRHHASVTLLVTVRDFALLGGVAGAVTGRDSVEVHSVTWSVDEDNGEWALVRADAIRAALLKGGDYAAALGGRVVSVDHVADAGLLGSDSSGRVHATPYGAARSVSVGGGGDMSLDPAPQVLSATIEARFTALVSALPTQ